MFPLFATGVIYTGGKFTAGVVDTGGDLPPVPLTPVANLPPVSTTLAKMVENLPPVSLISVANLPPVLSIPIPRIFEKVYTVLMEYSLAGGKLIHKNNQKQKIS